MTLHPELGVRRRSILWIGLLPEALFLICFAWVCAGVVHDSKLQEIRKADVIAVFGAAEYAGRPSPVLKARLDHAYVLYEQGLAPIVITTGGAAQDPRYSEGGVGRDYLMRRGVPEANLIAETQGSDTAQSAQRIGVIMRENGMHSCLAVSDAYHVFRIRRLLEREGVSVWVSPRPDSVPHAFTGRAETMMKEATSYILWKIGAKS